MTKKYKQNRRRKKIPTVGVFPMVSVFSYGQINPTVKMPRLTCTQFVVPPLLRALLELVHTYSRGLCNHREAVETEQLN